MDESVEQLGHQIDKEVSSQEEIAVSRRNKKKIKMSIYLTEEAELALTELYISRLRKNRKADRSSILCNAIEALYEEECMQQCPT